jgi:hypothetical protein
MRPALGENHKGSLAAVLNQSGAIVVMRSYAKNPTRDVVFVSIDPAKCRLG